MIFDVENHLEIKMRENILARFIIYSKKWINSLFLIFTYFLLHLTYRLCIKFTIPLIKAKLSIASISSAPAYDYKFQSIFPVAKTALPSSRFCQSATIPKKVNRTSHYSIDYLLTLHGLPPLQQPSLIAPFHHAGIMNLANRERRAHNIPPCTNDGKKCVRSIWSLQTTTLSCFLLQIKAQYSVVQPMNLANR